MRYEVFESRESPSDWVAAAVNDEGSGEIYTAEFSGPGARQLAEEYAEWKNGQLARQGRLAGARRAG
jgi:hypothetical protein